MESNNKNKKIQYRIILTCVFALTTLVLGMALYRSQSDRKLLESQLAGAQDVVAVTMDQQQQLAGADNLQEIRIMNGILQQQDKHQQWVDVAPVEDLLQADPVLAGRNKMQELITQNREAVQNGTISAEQISPLMAKAGTLTGVALVSASRVESSNNKTTAQPPKAQTGSNSTTTVTAPAATPVATPAPVQQPDNNNTLIMIIPTMTLQIMEAPIMAVQTVIPVEIPLIVEMAKISDGRMRFCRNENSQTIV